jgi:hypothetical protein
MGRRVAMNRRHVLSLSLVAALAVAAAQLVAGPAVAAVPHDEQGAQMAPRSRDLLDTGSKQRRWMSLPGSRIVVNPYDFAEIDARRATVPVTPVDYSNGPELPLNAAYYVADKADRLSGAAGVYLHDDHRQPRLRTALDDGFASLDEAWQVGPNLSAEVADGQVELTVHGAVAASLSRSVTLDLGATPYLQVSVPRTEGMWSLQVNDGTQSANTYLQRDTDRTGTITYDLPDLTGWHGTKTFRLSFVAIYADRPTYVDRLRIVGVDSPMRTATSFGTEWMPSALPFHASYADGTRLAGEDTFFDEDTVLRTMDVGAGDDGASALTLAGAVGGDASWDAVRHVLTVDASDYSYAVAFSRPPTRVRWYQTYLDFLLQRPAAAPVAGGYWSVEIPAPATDDRLGFAVGFAPGSGRSALAGERAAHPFRDGSWRDTAQRQARFWDDLLARVPHPRDFALHGVPTMGVTPAEVRREYYRAWVHLAANLLPPMPEAAYPYPQIANGKASLWMYGAPGAHASAQWESILETQFYAYLDPQAAWKAYEGLLSRVDDAGDMGGESLPSRKAQTGLVLYQLTGDATALRGVYPTLKRHLLWEQANPHWICCGDHPAVNHANERDADFVASLLVDLRYMTEIAHVLGMPDEERFWQHQRSTLFSDYLSWFWPTTDDPMQYYFVGEQGCDYRGDCHGNALDVAIGLHIDLLDDPAHIAGLMNRFDADYDPSGPFAGIAETRYPEFSFATYGLLDHGMAGRAAVMANAYLRDVVRAHMFAEGYGLDSAGGVRSGGVRPSAFGTMTVIDALWMKNGYRMDLGWPHFVKLPGEAGGIDGLSVRGRRLNERADRAGDSVVLSGSLVTDSCRDLAVPPGGTVALPDGCVRAVTPAN